MNRQLEGDSTTDWQLDPPGVDTDINANLDSTAWRRSHLPEPLLWLRSRSVTLTGDLVVACALTMMNASAQDVVARIRKTWLKDMQNRLQIRDCTGPPIHGALPGDEPPPPPTTMFA